MIHYNFPKGVKLLIILKNGDKIIDKYLDTKGRNLILEKQKIQYKKIRSTTILKNKGENL